MQRKLLGTKIFSKLDQKNFLRVSKDLNPAHTLKNNINQFKTRKPVVHGINLLICTLELFLQISKIKPKNVRCFFYKPIFLNEKIKFYSFQEGDKQTSVELQNENNSVFSKIIFYNYSLKEGKKKKNSKLPEILKLTSKLSKKNPIDFFKRKFKILLKERKNILNFPFVQKMYGKVFISALLATSYFIGMRCPGKNALFSGIDLNFNSIYNKKKYLIFDVANYEERIKMFTINVSGFMYLRIKSFCK